MSAWVEAHWIEFAMLVLAVIAIIVRVERRMGKALTREEHEQICRDRNQQVESKLDLLRRDMERRHEENREAYDKIETGITGTHQRLDALYRDLLNQRGGR